MAAAVLPTGVVTFLFSDIEGSTRLLQQLGLGRYKDVLASHHEVFRDAAGDAVVSTEGDSFFCAFSSPLEGVAVAAAVQRRLGERDWPAGIELRVRMGLHTGEGVLGGDDYVGLDVHRAARIASAGHGGQVLVSRATQAHVAGRLPEGLALRDLGEHRLKDLAEAEHLYQLVIPGLRTSFPALRSLAGAPAVLPDYLAAFVGRDGEIEMVIEAVRRARLVTLVGAGGSGKTRLAVEAARALAADHPGGVFFVPLADLDDPDLIAAHAAGALAVHEQAGRPIAATLVDFFASRRAVLVLDNCEHLADAAASLATTLLGRCPDLRILATSREALLVEGEQRLEVAPMKVGSLADPVAALQSDAVRLFATRAREVSPGFDATQWAETCVEICARLDGVPLAIELAAARTGMLAPPEILQRLDDRFHFLRSTTRGKRGRHQTLEAAIEWSYDLLDPEAQRVFRALAAFRGGFTLEAARRVCFPDGAGDGPVLDVLSGLYDKSLLTRETRFRRTRFGLLETIREYAAKLAAEAGEMASLEARHRDHYTEQARTESRRLGGADQLDAVDVLEEDHENFRAVMRRAVAAGRFDEAADVAGWLAWFWYVHSHFTEGERWAARLLARLPAAPARSWMRLLLGSAQFDARIGNYERADERLDLALDAAERLGVPRIEMWAHAYRGTNDLYQIRLDGARARSAAAQRLAEDLGDPIGLAYASYLAIAVDGWTAASAGWGAEAVAPLLERLEPIGAAVRALGERNMIGHVLQVEAMLAALAGRTGRAAATFDSAVAALAELGTVGCLCHCLEAASSLIAGELPAEAARIIGAADALRDRVGITVSPVEAQFRARAVSLASDALGEAAVERSLAAGARLGLAEAAQLARQSLARL